MFKYTSDKVIQVQYNSIYGSPKELVKWDGESIGNKVRDISDFGDLLMFLMWLFVLFGSYSVLGVLVSLSVLFHVVKKFKYLNTNYGPYMKHLLQVLESKGKIMPVKDYQVKSFWYNYRNSRVNALLNPGPYQPFSFWLVKSKFIKLGLIVLVRLFRKKVIFPQFKKWEKEHGSKYFQNPEDKKDVDEYYELNGFKNPNAHIPKMTFFRRTLLKVCNASYAFEIGTFGSVMQDVILWAGYDIFNYKSRLNGYSPIGLLNVWLCFIVFGFVAWELTK